MQTLDQKEHFLSNQLRELDGLLVAYSGGVDSAFLAWAAHRVLRDRMLAVIADSPSLPRSELADAATFAQSEGIPFRAIPTHEIDRPDYVKNDLDRCFHCKSELFARLRELQTQLGFSHLAYGMNADDLTDFRPGHKAAAQQGVVSPLKAAGLTKEDIRTLAKRANLRVWDRPATACLASRVAYGNPVTIENLGRIERAEAELRALGFRQLRVRDHGGLARIELAAGEMDRALSRDFFTAIAGSLKNLGFSYVTLDCEGFRSGSMNHAHANRVS